MLLLSNGAFPVRKSFPGVPIRKLRTLVLKKLCHRILLSTGKMGGVRRQVSIQGVSQNPHFSDAGQVFLTEELFSNSRKLLPFGGEWCTTGRSRYI
jgi:hypothetical protein